MRIVARVVLTVIGVVVLAVGAAAAWFVGPDDTVVVGETEFSGGTAYTAPGLFTVTDVSVVVTAVADDGEVFVGVANPVDVTDVTSGHDAFRISGFDVGTLHGAADGGDEEMPDPRGIDYLDSVSGEGEQTLGYPVDELSPQFVVHAPSGAAVTTSVGFRVDGVFWLCLAVVGVGAVVVVGGLLLTRRRRGGGPAESADDGEGPGAAAGAAEPDRAASPDDASGAERGRTPSPPVETPASDAPSSSGTLKRVAAGFGAGALLLPLSACAELPEQMADTEATKIAITADDLDEMWADYDGRRDAAVEAAAAPEFDAAGWEAADSGPALENDQYRTAIAEAGSDVDEYEVEDEVRTETSGEWVSAPAFDAYPMWAFVDQETESADEESTDADASDAEDGGAKNADGEDEGGETTGLAVVTRAAADRPWTVRSSFDVSVEEMPELPAVAETPSPEQLARADDVAAAIDAYLASGDVPEIIGDIGGLEEMRTGFEEFAAGEWPDGVTLSLDAAPFDETSVRVVPGEGSAYAVLDRVVTRTIDYPHDVDLWWADPFRDVAVDTGSELYSQQFLSAFVEVPAEGPATLLGVTMEPVVAGKR